MENNGIFLMDAKGVIPPLTSVCNRMWHTSVLHLKYKHVSDLFIQNYTPYRARENMNIEVQTELIHLMS